LLPSGSADVLVGTANEKANEKAASDTLLTLHSPAHGGVGGPGASSAAIEEMQKVFGAIRAKKLQQRLMELQAVDYLGQISGGSVAGICKYFDSLVFLPGVILSHCGR
jgi:hypothetical protein